MTRTVLAWLLYSRRRFYGTLGALLAAIILIGLLNHGVLGGGAAPVSAQPSAHPTPTVSASAPTVSAPTSAQPPVSAAPTERASAPTPAARERVTAEQEATHAARRWVTAWLDADQPPSQWRDAMAAWSTRTLTGLMRTAQPSAVPTGARLGGTRMRTMSTTYALVGVHMHGARDLDLSLVVEPDGWRVAQVSAGPPKARQ